MAGTNDPVEVARFLDLRQAEFARSVLEGSGIEAHVDQPFTASIAPHHMFGSGGVGVFVAAEQTERALDVLQSLTEEAPEGPEDEDQSDQGSDDPGD